MTPATLILLGSPLLASGSWAGLPDALEGGEPALDVLDVPVLDDETPPFGQRYLTSVVLALAVTRPVGPLVLVAHSGAGPLLPGVGRAVRDAAHRVGGYVFVDAGLPGSGLVNRLDLLRMEDANREAALHALLDADGRFPDWTLSGVVTRPRARAFFEEHLPTSDDWPDAPCGYLRASTAYAAAARSARARGWPVVERETDHHLPWLADPAGVAADLRQLMDLM
ncbi:MAG: hypothetical protein QOG69_1771 [Actinomycetota bacterium]|jgi:hypothetical protein|nr:hypothetical protein [Actinomycetota bacterium]